MRNCLIYKCEARTDVDEARQHSGNANGLMDSCLKVCFVVFTLLAENATAHLENCFETLPASQSILTESFHARLFDLVLYFLPSTTERSDLCLLAEFGGVRFRRRWAVDNSFLDVKDV